MNQRLVWNFEFSPKKQLPFPSLAGSEDDLKWEARFFWPGNQPIVLNLMDSSLLNLANYHAKYREDYYYLLPDCDSNIKLRHNDIFYKPLLKQAALASGYGQKINLSHLYANQEAKDLVNAHLPKSAAQIEKDGIRIFVKKAALVYKFATKPTIKLELARLELLKQVYFSACIEGKSLDLVETIAKHLLDKPVSCDYVTFLKDILKS